MEPGIIIALIAGFVLGIYQKQNAANKYIMRDRTIIDDIIGNR